MMRKRKGYPVYPLTAAQKFHFFYQNFCPKKEVLWCLIKNYTKWSGNENIYMTIQILWPISID